jgi:DNA-binding response OmpR family regulator
MKEFTTLLIEDDENDIFFLEHAMKKAGWPGTLRVVRDGRAGIAYLTGATDFADRAQHPMPSLVILDLNLPVKTGLDVLQSFRHHDPDNTVPVVVFTSSASDIDIREAYRFGANCYLTKPYHPDALLELVRVLMAHWTRFNHVLLPRDHL